MEAIVGVLAVFLILGGLLLATGVDDEILYMTLPQALNRLANIGGLIVAGLGLVAVAVLVKE